MLKSFLLKNKVDLIGCLETKVRAHKADKIKKYLGDEWEVFTDYLVVSYGRIWVCWKRQKAKVNVLYSDSQLVHCVITELGAKFQCLMTFVYGLNTIEGSAGIWDQLRNIEAGITAP